ncbi:type III toxin-antitoxin system ToxN/AbiQ family toxin [Konateibacter massiliensis]|uniref:type III toxin-antitoxin system ToxN/AbiQ family toxin n=1 Tax=Konateibacter massiliensis TaxID=2002841 RepID=UPI000C14729C|nr:type III toxin-antitoxin system ToxN/AbiQ family toxin [Konateibacter massiliensis]
MKFYDIDKDYVKYLQKFDKKVPNIEYSTNNKFVCGVVFKCNGIAYYAPISHITNKQQTNLQIFQDDKVISTIKFSFMIPAYDNVLVEKKFKEIAKQDQKYADLLYSEYMYCLKHKDEIYKKATSVYKIGCNKNHKLNYACCDFKLLESIYLNYDIKAQVAATEEQN